MRSSKSRSRSKTNRPRTLGNIINRVFDSSGPEGKVRGTPQQIIEKYLFLARDAQLSNDRVAAENFLQHAEHYTRLLGEANRELAAEQETRQQYQPQTGGQNSGNQTAGNQNGNGNGNQSGQRDRDGQRYENRNENRQDNPRPDNRQDNPRADNRQDNQRSENRQESRREDRGNDRSDFRADYRNDDVPDRPQEDTPRRGGGEVIDLSGDEDIGLVETPEATHRAPPRDEQREPAPRRDQPPREPRAPKPASQPASIMPPMPPLDAEPVVDTGAEPKKTATRRPRGPRKPSEKVSSDDSTGGTPREAAK